MPKRMNTHCPEDSCLVSPFNSDSLKYAEAYKHAYKHACLFDGCFRHV